MQSWAIRLSRTGPVARFSAWGGLLTRNQQEPMRRRERLVRRTWLDRYLDRKYSMALAAYAIVVSISTMRPNDTNELRQ